ncbi:hypothetical protein BB559_005933 [Furculomyces boomerangus]|uniref:N-acetyltransferase domain-containing protein n=2 Tax=Harpellales TaxID=61421 RepID=A0A2T9Y5V0_9FUNG|nr:hypothetical protein BB559_005933 [Furculomyces boomerangus]PVZ98233.1 hypothetical protein BB558_005765 [Smittium angustum]
MKLNVPNPNISIPDNIYFKGKNIHLSQYDESHDVAMKKLLSCPNSMKNLEFMSKLPEGWTLEESRKRREYRNKKQHEGAMANLTILIPKSNLLKLGVADLFDESEFLFPNPEKDSSTKIDLNEPYIVAGCCGLQEIVLDQAIGECGIILDYRLWRGGIGSEALLRVLEYGFEGLQLHRISFKTTEKNDGMRGWLERYCGIELESIEKECIFFDGVFIDSYTYAIFERDWHSHISKLLEKYQ